MSNKPALTMPQLGDRPGWTEESEIDSDTGAFRQKYFFRGIPAQRIPITSNLARKLAGYGLIERDLRAVHGWLKDIEVLSKEQVDGASEGYYPTDKSDPEHSLASALFIAAVTCYAKCFTKADGRGVKLEETAVPSELRDTHRNAMSLRHNFTAHGRAEGYEKLQVVLVLNPERRHGDDSKFLMRESFQLESWIGVDSSESFLTLVERVRENVLQKIGQLNDRIFAEEINPKGLDYWYSQNKY